MVDEILYWLWDPIGVNDNFASRSEYGNYVPGVIKHLLAEDSDEHKTDAIAGHLARLAKENMGISSVRKDPKEVAQRLVEDFQAWKLLFG